MHANPPLHDIHLTQKAREGVYTRWVMLAVLTTARLAMGFQFQSIGSASPFLVADLGIDYGSVGFLIGLYLLPGVFLALPGGFIGKRFGDKRVVIVGLVLMFVGGILVGASDSYKMVCVGRFISGIGAVLLSVMLTKMTTDWFAGREIVLAIAILINAWPIGIGIALVTLGPLGEASSWNTIFYITAAFAIFGLLLIATLYKSPVIKDVKEGVDTRIFTLSSRELGHICLAGATWGFYNVAYAIMLGFAPSFLISQGDSVTRAGFTISLNTWFVVASVQTGGLLAQKWGRINAIMLVGILVWGIGLVLLPIIPSPWWLLIIMGIFGGAPAGAIVSLPSEILKPENRGPGLGLFLTWYYAAMSILPPVAGWFQDISGAAGAPLYFGGLVMVASLPFLGLLRGLQKRLSLKKY
jgi:MFS family permease